MNSEETLLLNKLFSFLFEYLSVRDNNFVLSKHCNPESLSSKFDLSLGKALRDNVNLLEILNESINFSLNTSNALFMNQLYGGTDLIAVFGDFLTSIMNTSMATYEISPLFTLIEKECIEMLGKFIGFNKDNFDGTFTAGGSISNLTAMILAKNKKFPETKFLGLKEIPPFKIFISEMAHYSFLKGVMLLGFGTESIIKIKSNAIGKMDIDDLNIKILKEKESGCIPLMVIGTAGTTINGIFDNLEKIGEIAKKNNLWFHIDACYGGSLLFSNKYKKILQGIELADSISWNLHKMMGIPLICSALIVKEKGLLEKSFSINADYLFHDDKYEYDLGNKSLQCGRRVDSFKLWLSWKYHGNEGFEKRVNSILDKAKIFSKKISVEKNLKLFSEPESGIVCFQFIPPSSSENNINEINKKIRNSLFEEGEIIFNYAEIKGKTVIRCVISNPNISELQMDNILKKIIEKANYYLKL